MKGGGGGCMREDGGKDDLPRPQLYVVAVAASGIHIEKGKRLDDRVPFRETVGLSLSLSA